MAAGIQAAGGVPFWGAREPSPAGTDPALLKPGQFIWDADVAPKGPVVIVVSIPEQRAYVYRNGVEIGVSTTSTGKPGHATPTGIFTILNKDRDHHSKTYNDAPMPFSERLTWDGVALHAGGLPGYPSSHGCVHLPSAFAERLFGITQSGMTVVIANDSTEPAYVSHPALLAPVNVVGTPSPETPLPADTDMRWDPAKSPAGPVTILVSAADRRILVFRNGVEIGRAKITITDPATPLGTKAFVLMDGAGTGPDKYVPGRPALRWMGIAVSGQAGGANVPMNLKNADRVNVPPAFVKDVYALLTPGATLYVTDAPALAETTGPALNVVNSDPPPALP